VHSLLVSVRSFPLARDCRWRDDCVMSELDGSGVERVVRRRRSVSEKRRIVELTFAPGASVALVARAHGVNANQVFKWRREFERGKLVEPVRASSGLLAVTVSSEMEMRAAGAQQRLLPPASIHIEFPGRALVSVEVGADPILLRMVLESMQK
jgi:transposase